MRSSKIGIQHKSPLGPAPLLIILARVYACLFVYIVQYIVAQNQHCKQTPEFGAAALLG